MTMHLAATLTALLRTDRRFQDDDGELRKHNEQWIKRIHSPYSADEQTTPSDELMQWTYLRWYVVPRHPVSARASFVALGREDDGCERQRHLLCQLLDTNKLYFNASDMDDIGFAVPDGDKRLARQFLGAEQ